jgi:hypothetical protein
MLQFYLQHERNLSLSVLRWLVGEGVPINNVDSLGQNAFWRLLNNRVAFDVALELVKLKLDCTQIAKDGEDTISLVYNLTVLRQRSVEEADDFIRLFLRNGMDKLVDKIKIAAARERAKQLMQGK